MVHEDTRESGANLRILNFKRHSVKTDGTPQWYLDAKEAYLFTSRDSTGRIIVYEFTMDLFSSEGASSGSISAFRGEVNHEEGRIFVEGDVLFRDSEGRELRTDHLTYTMETDTIDTDAEVELTEEGMKTICRGGMYIEKENNKQICRNPAGSAVTRPEASDSSSPGGSSFDSIFN